MTEGGRRIYVTVDVEFKEDGQMLPRVIAPGDGKKYKVDRVLDIRSEDTLKDAGQGDRYTVQVKGQQSYLYFERTMTLSGTNLGRWHIVKRTA